MAFWSDSELFCFIYLFALTTHRTKKTLIAVSQYDKSTSKFTSRRSDGRTGDCTRGNTKEEHIDGNKISQSDNKNIDSLSLLAVIYIIVGPR